MKKIVVIFVMVIGLTLSGCSSADEAMHDPDYEYNEGFNDENTDLDDPEPVVNEPTEQGGEVVSNNALPPLLNRKIIYRANLVMAVTDPTATYNNVMTTMATYTAYIESADITTNRYEVTLRVLSSEFDDFVEDIKTEGELVSYSKTSEDVTNSYSTFEASKLALETRHARILELIEDADNLSVILTLEKERYEIEAELNEIGSTLANYDSLVDYSTITLLIREAVEEIIVLPRTDQPNVYINEVTKNAITIELYNHSDENVTLNIDVYLNGEFITEYEENTFADSKTIVTFDELKSNKEYTFKVTALASEHRVSLQDTLRIETEKTYGNKTTNTFISSVNTLVVIFETVGLVITAVLPFAFTIAVIGIPARIMYLKKKGKTAITMVGKEEERSA